MRGIVALIDKRASRMDWIHSKSLFGKINCGNLEVNF